jgi:uncharacterized protein
MLILRGDDMSYSKIFFLFVFLISGNLKADEVLSDKVQELITKGKAGDVEAQFRVATAYDWGKGAPRDGAEAMKWYLLAAEQGFAEAQNSVGSGLQAEKRYAEALPWYEKATEQGNPLATNNLAYLHDLGLGVKQDRQKAFELYSQAADLGWSEAMWNIANMYGAGQLGKKDMVMACVWTFRTGKYAAPRDPLVARSSDYMQRFQKILSTDQLATCKLDGDNWAPKKISAKIQKEQMPN